MRMTIARRALCTSVAILLGLGIAGCSGSNKDKSATFASTAPTVDTTSILTKTDFIAKMNDLCSAVDQQRMALPVPTGLTDYPNIIANLSGTLRILPAFITQADALIQRSEDKAELTTKWLDIEKADYTATKPIAERMVVDSTAKDQTKVATDGEALASAPDHSADIASFMTSYGLTSCATLETAN